jgi:hypothetical protein
VASRYVTDRPDHPSDQQPESQPEQSDRSGSEADSHDPSVRWLAGYVYGTISTLVAIAGLTFETNPAALTTAGVVIVGAVAIWLAHALSGLVTMHSWRRLELTWADVADELRGSWSVVSAAIPATIIFILAEEKVWSVRHAFAIAEVVGVLALAVVGIGTAGGPDHPAGRRFLYILALVMVGVFIVLLESVVHLL